MIRTQAVCPACSNMVSARIDDMGVTFPAHRISRERSTVCRTKR